MSRWLSLLCLGLLAGLLLACEAKPLGPEKADYAGHWRGDGVDLVIEAEGRVKFERKHGAGVVKISGPIAVWVEDDFVVGVMVQKTRFDVTEPPHEVDGRWRMTVDGVALVRDE